MGQVTSTTAVQTDLAIEIAFARKFVLAEQAEERRLKESEEERKRRLEEEEERARNKIDYHVPLRADNLRCVRAFAVSLGAAWTRGLCATCVLRSALVS